MLDDALDVRLPRHSRTARSPLVLLLVGVSAPPSPWLRFEADEDELDAGDEGDEGVTIGGVRSGAEGQRRHVEDGHRLLVARRRGTFLGVATEDADDIGVGETEDLAEGVGKRQAAIVAGDDGGVAGANEAEVADRGTDEVTFGAAGEDEVERDRGHRPRGLIGRRQGVEVDSTRCVTDGDEGVILGDGERSDRSRITRCARVRSGTGSTTSMRTYCLCPAYAAQDLGVIKDEDPSGIRADADDAARCDGDGSAEGGRNRLAEVRQGRLGR
jgi:hypothetical protein